MSSAKMDFVRSMFVIYVNREHALPDLGLAREGREADPD
jgi:hypothetical protein